MTVAATLTVRARIEGFLARLRRAADGYELPGDACASYTSLYQRLRELESDTFRTSASTSCRAGHELAS